MSDISLSVEDDEPRTVKFASEQAKGVLDDAYGFFKQIAECTSLEQYNTKRAKVLAELEADPDISDAEKDRWQELNESGFATLQVRSVAFMLPYEDIQQSGKWDKFYQDYPLILTFDGTVDAQISKWLGELSKLVPLSTGAEFVDILSATYRLAKKEVWNIITNPLSAATSFLKYAGQELLGVYKINNMTPEQIEGALNDEKAPLHPNNIAKLSRMQVAYFIKKPGVFDQLKGAQVTALQRRHFNNSYFRPWASRNILNEIAVDQIKYIKPEVFGKIHSSLLANMDLARFKELTKEQAGQMNRYQLAKLDNDKLSNLGTLVSPNDQPISDTNKGIALASFVPGKALAGIDGINGRFGRSNEKFETFVNMHVTSLTADQINKFHIGRLRPPFPRTAQIKFIAGKLSNPDLVSSAVFKGIEGRQLRKLDFDELQKIAQGRDIKDFSTAQINALRVPGWVTGPSKGLIQAFGTKIASMEKDEFKKILPKQIRAMAPEQFAGFNDPSKHVAYFNEMTGDQVRALSSAALRKIPVDVREKFDPGIVKLMGQRQRMAFAEGVDLEPKDGDIKDEIDRKKSIKAILDATPNNSLATIYMRSAIYGTFKSAIGVRTLNKMSPEEVKAWKDSPNSPVTPAKISSWSGIRSAFVNNLVFHNMDKEQVGALKSVQFNTIFRRPPNTLLQVLSRDQVAWINPQEFKKIKLSRLELLDANTVGPDGNTNKGRMSALTEEQLATRTAARSPFLRGTFMDSNPFNIWTGDQIRSINPDAINGISAKVIRRTAPLKVAQFSAEQFNAMDKQINKGQFKAITRAAFRNIPADEFKNIDLKDRITYRQVLAITSAPNAPKTKPNWLLPERPKFSTLKLEAMTTKQFNDLASTKVTPSYRLGFTKPAIQVFTSIAVRAIPIDKFLDTTSEFQDKLSSRQISALGKKNGNADSRLNELAAIASTKLSSTATDEEKRKVANAKRAIQQFNPTALARGLSRMNKARFNAIDPKFFEHLSKEQVEKLRYNKVGVNLWHKLRNNSVLSRISKEQFAGFGENIQYMKPSTLRALLRANYKEVKKDNKRNIISKTEWLTAEQIEHLTPTQLNKLGVNFFGKNNLFEKWNIDQILAITPEQLDMITPRNMQGLQKAINSLIDKIIAERGKIYFDALDTEPPITEEEAEKLAYVGLKAKYKNYDRIMEAGRAINSGSNYESNLSAAARITRDAVNIVVNIRNLKRAQLKTVVKLTTPKELALQEFFKDLSNTKIRALAKQLPNVDQKTMKSILTAHAEATKQQGNLRYINAASFAQSAFREFREIESKCVENGVKDPNHILSIYTLSAGKPDVLKTEGFIKSVAAGAQADNVSVMERKAGEYVTGKETARESNLVAERQKRVAEYRASDVSEKDDPSGYRSKFLFSGNNPEFNAKQYHESDINEKKDKERYDAMFPEDDSRRSSPSPSMGGM